MATVPNQRLTKCRPDFPSNQWIIYPESEKLPDIPPGGMMFMTFVQVKRGYRIYLLVSISKRIRNMFCIRLHFQMNCQNALNVEHVRKCMLRSHEIVIQ